MHPDTLFMSLFIIYLNFLIHIFVIFISFYLIQMLNLFHSIYLSINLYRVLLAKHFTFLYKYDSCPNTTLSFWYVRNILFFTIIQITFYLKLVDLIYRWRPRKFLRKKSWYFFFLKIMSVNFNAWNSIVCCWGWANMNESK